MPGFVSLWKFLNAIYERERNHGRLTIRSAESVDVRFKVWIKEKLNLSDEEFKGLIGALFYFGLVRYDRVIRIDSIDDLYDHITRSREFYSTLEALVYTGRKFADVRSILKKDKPPYALSLTGELLREISEKIVRKPRNLLVSRATAMTVIEIARSLLPFVQIPSRHVIKEYPRDINMLISGLEELGGITEINTLYEYLIETDRIPSADVFLKSLAKGVLIHDIFEIGKRAEKSKKHARIALAWTFRAGDDLANTAPDRVRDFIDRVTKTAFVYQSALRYGFRPETIGKEIMDKIDESVARDAENFLAAYGSLKIEFRDLEDIQKALRTR